MIPSLGSIGTPLQPGATKPVEDGRSHLESTSDDAFNKILSFLSTSDSDFYFEDDMLETIIALCTLSNSTIVTMCDRLGIYERLCVKFGIGGLDHLAAFAKKLGIQSAFSYKDAIIIISKTLRASNSLEPIEYHMFVGSTDDERIQMAREYIDRITEGDDSCIPLLAYLTTLSHASNKFQALLQDALGFSLGWSADFNGSVDLRLTRLFIRLGGSIYMEQPTIGPLGDTLSWIDRVREVTNMLQDTGRYITQTHHITPPYITRVELHVDESGLRWVLSMVDTYRPILKFLETLPND